MSPVNFLLNAVAILNCCSFLASHADAFQENAKAIRVGVIGLDTSHSVAFSKLLNGTSENAAINQCTVVCAYPHGSADIESSSSRIHGFTNDMKSMGVPIVDSIDELIKNVDAVLLETNDGRLHLEQVIPVLRSGKPVFVDKPIAGSLTDAIAIFRVAEHFGTPVFSSSSLRFVKPALAARKGELVGKVLGCTTYSPATIEPTHPDLYWYGIHGVEQLFTVMGGGCRSVQRTTTDATDLVVGVWDDGRIGTFRGNRKGPHSYGGTVFGEKGQASSGGNEGYEMLVQEIAKFFVSGKSPLDSDETIQIYAFMSAADISIQNEGKAVLLGDVIEAAEAKVADRLKELNVNLATKKSDETAKLTCRETDDSIVISNADKILLQYNKAVTKRPADVNEEFARSGYIHPIITPGGKVVTGDFPLSHPHQHAFFMAWVKTKFEGREIDFWNQAKKSGRISHSKVLKVINDDKRCGFSVELLHKDITTPEKPVEVLRENWEVTASDCGDNCFSFDLVSRQTNVADSPLVLEKHVYGGLGVRGNAQWDKPGANRAMNVWSRENAASTSTGISVEPPGIDVMGHDFLTSEKKMRTDGNHTTAKWTAMYGPVDGKTAGIAVLMHPENFRFPQPVRLHPSKPYFSVAPVVAGQFEIKPGETYVTRMRVIAFDGDVDAAMLDHQWQMYSVDK
jgi:predicted dehydrogenase